MAVAPKRGPKINDINDPRLVKALAHPLRVQILQALEDREASPSELAEEFDCPLPNLSYHFRMLVQLDMLVLKRTAPRRGAIEHYYRAKPGIQLADSAWDKIPTLVANKVIGQTLQQLGNEALEAAASNGFKNGALSRKNVTLDTDGWKAVQSALADADAAIDAAVKASQKRGNGNVPGTVAMLLFAEPQELLGRVSVMEAARALHRDGERVNLASITRRLFPRHRGQIGKQDPPGRDVQALIDTLVVDGDLRVTGTYKRGTVYEPK